MSRQQHADSVVEFFIVVALQEGKEGVVGLALQILINILFKCICYHLVWVVQFKLYLTDEKLKQLQELKLAGNVLLGVAVDRNYLVESFCTFLVFDKVFEILSDVLKTILPILPLGRKYHVVNILTKYLDHPCQRSLGHA